MAYGPSFCLKTSSRLTTNCRHPSIITIVTICERLVMQGYLKEAVKRSGGAHLKGLWQISRARGALATSGWIASLKRGFPSDEGGNPVPWISYPAISFLAPLVRATCSVFEFGTGYSTLSSSRHAEAV